MAEQRTTGDHGLTDLLFEKAGVGLCLAAPDGTVVRANAEWLRSTGFELAQVIGEDLVALFPDARDLALAMHARARAGETVSVPPHQVLLRGRPTWWEGSISPVPMEGGTGLLVTAREITEQVARAASDATARQRAERGLEDAERQLRALATSDLIGIVTADLSGRVTWANDSFLELLGIERADLEADRIRCDALTPPEWREADRRAAEELHARGHAGPFEKEYVRADGTRVPVLLGATRIGGTSETITYVLDLTPRKRIEREVREAKARLAATLAHSPLVVFEQDLALRYGWVHDPVRSMGHRAAEIVGRTDAELFERAEDARATERLKREVLATGRALRADVVIAAAGEERVYDLMVEPKRGEDGALAGVTCVAVDVTAQRTAVERLRESEAQLRLALEASHTGIWTWDLETDAVTWSPESYAVCGVPEGAFELTGAAFFHLVHPADRARVEATVRGALADRTLYRCEFRMIRSDGSEVWVENLGRGSYGPDGRPLRLLGTVTDVSDRKRSFEALRSSERRLRALADTVPQLVWEAGPDGQVRSYNARREQYAGHTVDGRAAWQPLVHPDDLARTWEAWRRAVESREPYACEHRLRMADGTFRWHVSRANPVDEGGRTTWYGTATDIDDRVREHRATQREREARLTEMESRIRFSEMFVGILGHDLRDPLSAITLGATLLRSEAASPQAQSTARRIASSAERMRRMIEQLLDLTRARMAGGLALDPAPLDLAALAQRVVEEAEAAHRRRIELQVSGDARGAWDASLLEQLLGNLAGNACQHGTPGTPVRVRVEGRPDVVRVEVRNDGVIPAELLPAIFDPFRRGARAGSRRTGLGLGLFIAHEIARAHGGAIRVESSDADGTCFTVELPRSVRAPGRAFAERAPPGDAAGQAAHDPA